MICYKSGGCGVYENHSCNECPASKPEYLHKNQINDYYKGARDFIKWLLTNDKYAACIIDTDEECIICDVGLTEDMWVKSADELLKEFQNNV